MCSKCKNERCSGYYRLHIKEFSKRWELMQQELTENPDRKFVMIKSPSSDEAYTHFFELHVIDGVPEAERGMYEDRTGDTTFTMPIGNLTRSKKCFTLIDTMP